MLNSGGLGYVRNFCDKSKGMVIDAPSLENAEILGKLRAIVDRAFAKAKEARDADLMGECVALIAELDRKIGAAKTAELLQQSSKGLLSQ